MDKLHFTMPENCLFIMVQLEGKDDLQEIVLSGTSFSSKLQVIC